MPLSSVGDRELEANVRYERAIARVIHFDGNIVRTMPWRTTALNRTVRIIRVIPVGFLALIPSAGMTSFAPMIRPPSSVAGCPVNLADELHQVGRANEVITVEAPNSGSTSAQLVLWQTRGRCFTRIAGPWTAAIGRNGLSTRHHEGDGTTPTGIFGIGGTIYGIAADPGVHVAYHRLACGDWWDEDPSSSPYNDFVHIRCGAVPAFKGDSEALWTETPAYTHFAVIEYNRAPTIPGKGSAIFLHEFAGGPTDGCVAIGSRELVMTLDWLSPLAHPVIVIGTTSEIRNY